MANKPHTKNFVAFLKQVCALTCTRYSHTHVSALTLTRGPRKKVTITHLMHTFTPSLAISVECAQHIRIDHGLYGYWPPHTAHARAHAHAHATSDTHILFNFFYFCFSLTDWASILSLPSFAANVVPRAEFGPVDELPRVFAHHQGGLLQLR